MKMSSVRAGGNVEPVASAYYYDLSYMTPGGRAAAERSQIGKQRL